MLKLVSSHQYWQTLTLAAIGTLLLGFGSDNCSFPLFLSPVDAFDCEAVTCSSPSDDAKAKSGGPDFTYTYGPATSDGGYKDQVGDIFLPSAAFANGEVPVAVLVHGGYWQNMHTRLPGGPDSMIPIAHDLANDGYIVVNIEYRRGKTGGGFPETFDDMIDAVDALQCIKDVIVACDRGTNKGLEMDLNNLAIIGHSTGGHLALWRALEFGIPSKHRRQLKHTSPSEVRPNLVVPLAAVSDLTCPCSDTRDTCQSECALPTEENGASSGCNCPDFDERITCHYMHEFLQHGSLDISSPEKKRSYLPTISPYHMVDNANKELAREGATQIYYILQGDADERVSYQQSRNLFAKGKDLKNVQFEMNTPAGMGHFDVIRTDTPAWNGVKGFLHKGSHTSRKIIDAETLKQKHASNEL